MVVKVTDFYRSLSIYLSHEATRRLARDLFDRWIILPAHEALPDLAWSGSRWVRIGGPVQICNFVSRGDAETYAEGAGLEVAGNEMLYG